MKKYGFPLLLALLLALLLGGFVYCHVRFTELYDQMNWNQ